MKSTHSTESTDDLRAAVAYVERKLATELGWLGEDDTRDHRGHRNPPVNVTLARPAWLILSTLARQEQLTLSQWLIARHEAEGLQA